MTTSLRPSHPTAAVPPAGARLLGVGAAQPDAHWTGDELGAPFGKDGAWIEARTGIRSLRRIEKPDELGVLAQRAARDALEAAGIASDRIDLVITASCSAAAGPWDTGRLARGLAARAGHMQINAACSGFCYALSSAQALIRAGSAQHVLVVAVEQMSALVDGDDLGTSIIFGDGAGAAVVGPCEPGTGAGIGPAVWGSDGDQAGLIDCGPVIGGRLQMAGRQVFRWAVESMPAIAREACARAGVALADIDVFVPHQANARIVEAIAKKLGLTDAVVADSVRHAGNTSAASVPIALADLARQGRSRTGQLALLLGFGAGLSYAGQVVVLP
ncbi:beta-ketoacyl-ACP synthase 3 [Jatrophihabitans endophyticus]|uniref:beta-ketoacyl-ACP synthase 3 n=1 Tax=Jatrophihabitans endophyticus TaxID=1206085 RepID=UPI0019F5E3D4|nr:beta-ketoacyl-ACP synthase 3 [Jatrophihabitans endophyticus]MBE7188526.1 beta-ketoacyl-ACP synthase 3 [Jatrophihabitans endophyticus]